MYSILPHPFKKKKKNDKRREMDGALQSPLEICVGAWTSARQEKGGEPRAAQLVEIQQKTCEARPPAARSLSLAQNAQRHAADGEQGA